MHCNQEEEDGPRQMDRKEKLFTGQQGDVHGRLDGSERKAKGKESRKGIFDQTTSPALNARIRSCIFPVNKEG